MWSLSWNSIVSLKEQALEMWASLSSSLYVITLRIARECKTLIKQNEKVKPSEWTSGHTKIQSSELDL